MTKLEHVHTDDSDHADAFRVIVLLSSCELVQLHTVGSSAMLPTKKRRDEREPLPRQRGGEELLPNGCMFSSGTLEPKQENTWCDGRPHGFTSWPCRKEGCAYLQELAGHPEQAKEGRFHKDTFEAPAEVKHLVVS